MKKLFTFITFLFVILQLASCKEPNHKEPYYEYLKDTETITVTQTDWYYVFKPKQYTTGIIFYPKNDIDVVAYAPLMHKLADEGYVTILLKNYELKEKSSVEVALNSYDFINVWYIGGHSSGGIEATKYLEDNHIKFKGLFLLAAYSEVDLTNTNLKILSIYGQNDKILDSTKYNDNLINLGDDFEEYIIQGGNHSYFHSALENEAYDKATITSSLQQEITIEQIIILINKIATPDNTDDSGNDDTTDDFGNNDNTDDSGNDDNTDDSGNDDTTDDSGNNDNTDDSGNDDTTDDSGNDDTTDNSGNDNTTDDSGNDDTTDDSGNDETTDDSGNDDTTDDSGNDDTTDNSDEIKLSFSELTTDCDYATISKNIANETIISYSECPLYYQFSFEVTNYDSKYPFFEIKFTASDSVTMCIEIDGNIDWSIGHKSYYGDEIQLQTIDTTEYNLKDSFIINLYLDSEATILSKKTIVIHSLEFNKTETSPDDIEIPNEDGIIYYKESVETFANPDRGFYDATVISTNKNEVSSIKESLLYNNALLHLRIDISEFSSKYNGTSDIELTNEMLSSLDELFTKINNSGACSIIRFSYDNGYDGNIDMEPEINMILKHIEQFTPLLNKHKNMITAIECGLVGPWGEMHSSQIANQETYNKILDKYLACLDYDIKLLVRRPKFIYKYYGLTLETLDQFDYENNRLGCYNDGYLGSSSDLGTFDDRDIEIAFLEKINATYPYGGEVTKPESSYNQLSSACNEMFKTNLSYLNIAWNDVVVKRWQNTEYTLDDPLYKGQSEFTYITNHLGYRFVCKRLEYSVTDTLNFSLYMKNVGFGELYKPKKAYVILRNADNQYVYNFDYQNEMIISKEIDITNLESGDYELYFVLADDFTTKAIRGIRFANTNMYNDELQANKLATITIE